MTESATFKRNILLTLSGFAFIAALYTGLAGGPPTLWELFGVLMDSNTAILCVLGVGHLCVSEPVEPWYSRKHAFWFLLPALLCSTMYCLVVVAAFLDRQSRWEPASMYFSILAVQSVWLVLFDQPDKKQPAGGQHQVEVRQIRQITTVGPPAQGLQAQSRSSVRQGQLTDSAGRTCPRPSHIAQRRP